jgi:hypothetical protein
MPNGGITIFFIDTGPRASRIRQVRTAASPINEPKAAPGLGKGISATRYLYFIPEYEVKRESLYKTAAITATRLHKGWV